jgi:hypothetical protein
MKKWKIERGSIDAISKILSGYVSTLSESTDGKLIGYYKIKYKKATYRHEFRITDKDKNFDVKVFNIHLREKTQAGETKIMVFSFLHNTVNNNTINLDKLESYIDGIIDKPEMGMHLGYLMNLNLMAEQKK